MDNWTENHENDLIDDEYHYDNWIAEKEAYEEMLADIK